MRVLLSCSKTKKVKPNTDLVWTDGSTTSEWLKSLDDSSKTRLHPKELYTGRATSEQVRIADSFEMEVWFASAGVGLIDGSDESAKIPAYEASFSSGGNGPSATQWSEMHSSSATKLEGGRVTLLLIPAPYLRVLEPSLIPFAEKMITFDRSSILVENGASVIDLHPRIREVMQCAASDYWTEVLRLVLPEGVGSKKLEEVNRKAGKLPDRELRTKVSDSELLRIILALPESVSSAQEAVRHIRDVEKVAALDKRVSKFWKMKKNQTNSD